MYLLDTMVVGMLMRTPASRDRNVAAWLASVDASSLGTSALVVREVWDGIVAEARNPRKAAVVAVYERQAAMIFDAFDERILPVDRAVAVAWSRLLPGRSKGSLDIGIAATAGVHGAVMVTRNTADFLGLGVRLLDPFHSPAVIREP